MPDLRFGVAFSPLKTRIIDIVKRSGQDGISASDICKMIYDRPKESSTLAVHIMQINDMLASQDWRIRGLRGRHLSVYRLVKEPPK